ncbi:MAG TPA: hypothetical protein PK280_07110 [Planctomycetota bacterium]|nr:hypothetical protein [Planctomycetota bacterium]
MIRGEIVWFFAYDVGFECRMEAAAARLAGRSGFRKPQPYRGTPQGAAIYTPLELDLPTARHAGPPAIEGVRRTARIYSMGAVSVALRLPFEEESLDELLPACLIGEIEDSEIRALARASAEEVVRELGDTLVRPQPAWDRCEAYKVICVTEAPGMEDGARKWLAAHRADVAALLLGEGPAVDLAAEQVDESLRLAYSFTESDIAVVDWNGMLALDPSAEYEELLHVAEVANLQMAELRAHDALLDRAIDRAYDDMESQGRRPALFRNSVRLLHDLREQRIELARIADEILNLSKYFGDWHLARIYEALSQRFHLAEWEEQLERSLRTVDSLYEMITKEIFDRRMLILEAMIVGLFVLDLVIIGVQLLYQAHAAG